MADNVSASVEVASGNIQGGSIDGAQLNNCSGIMTTNGDTQPLHLELTLNEPLPIPFYHFSCTVYSQIGTTIQISAVSDTVFALTPYESDGETPAEGAPFSFIVWKLGPR
jgi:hypothetical protein